LVFEILGITILEKEMAATGFEPMIKWLITSFRNVTGRFTHTTGVEGLLARVR